MAGCHATLRALGKLIPPARSFSAVALLKIFALAASLVWAYGSTLQAMAARWAHEPQYSHGYLVPVFALFLLWQRRQLYRPGVPGSSWGLALLGAAVTLRLAGAYFYLPWLDAASLLPCLLALFLLLGGWHAVRWAWPAVAFLLFMLPLPYRVEGALAYPLQRLATQASTFALLLLGYPAAAEGNIITINEARIGVAEACGGLSMLLTFLALAAAFALVARRPLADRIAMLVSAVPIALLANVMRITATGILYEEVGSAAARAFFHDLAGWFMMAFALALLWLELTILSHLFLEPEDSAPLPLLRPWLKTPSVPGQGPCYRETCPRPEEVSQPRATGGTAATHT